MSLLAKKQQTQRISVIDRVTKTEIDIIYRLLKIEILGNLNHNYCMYRGQKRYVHSSEGGYF